MSSPVASLVNDVSHSKHNYDYVIDPTVEGCVFDCDGTLVDTMPFYYESWKMLNEYYNVSFTEQEFYSLSGLPIDKIIEYILRNNNKCDTITVDEYIVKKKEMSAKVKLATPAIDVVVNIVKKYKELNIPMAVASSGWKDHVMDSLKKNNLLEYFTVIVTADDMIGKPGKPAPDIFLEACKQLNVNPMRTVGFEDADFGMQALRASSMIAVDVRRLNGYPRDI